MNPKQLHQFLDEGGFKLEITPHGYGSAVEGEPPAWYWRARFLQRDGGLVKFKNRLSANTSQIERSGWGLTPDVALYALVAGPTVRFYWSALLARYVRGPDFSVATRGTFTVLALQGHLHALGLENDKTLHVAASLGLARGWGVEQSLLEGLNKELRDIGKPELTEEEAAFLSRIVGRFRDTDTGDLRADLLGIAAGVVSEILTNLEIKGDGSRRTRAG